MKTLNQVKNIAILLDFVVSIIAVVLLTQFDYVRQFFFSHFIGG